MTNAEGEEEKRSNGNFNTWPNCCWSFPLLHEHPQLTTLFSLLLHPRLCYSSTPSHPHLSLDSKYLTITTHSNTPSLRPLGTCRARPVGASQERLYQDVREEDAEDEEVEDEQVDSAVVLYGAAPL